MTTFLVIHSLVGIILMFLISKALDIRVFGLKNALFILIFGAIGGIFIPLSFIIIAVLFIYLKKSGGMKKIISIGADFMAGKM